MTARELGEHIKNFFSRMRSPTETWQDRSRGDFIPLDRAAPPRIGRAWFTQKPRILFGAYTYGGIWQGEEPIKQLETLLGQDLAIAHWFMNWSHDWDSRLVTLASQKGRIPLITWENTDVTVKQIADGERDAYILSWAEGAKAFQKPIYLRPFPEMNGDWTHWHGDAPTLVRAWRRIVGLFRQVGADDVRFVWSPNATDQPATPENRMELYYPGKDVVDVLALDGYNWGTTRSWSSWQSFEEIFRVPYGRITALGPQPVWIAETACAEQGGPKHAWIADMFATQAFPRLAAIVWFNENKEADWRINSSPRALAAFKEELDDLVVASLLEHRT